MSFLYKGVSYTDTQTNLEPIVLLHGWMQNKESWEPIITLLSASYRVITPDLPGFGESNDPQFLNFTPEDYAQSIIALLDHLNISTTHLLGHSFGGRLAIVIAKEYPERLKTLIIFSSPGLGKKKQTLISQLNKHIPHTKIIQKAKSRLKQNFGSRDYLQAGKLETVFRHAVTYDIKNCLPYIHTPTLIIWGSKDTELSVSDAYIFNEKITDSKLVILKGYGHFAHLEAPQLFTHTITSFMHNEE